MIDYENFYKELHRLKLSHWATRLPPQVDTALNPRRHGTLATWLQLIEGLPEYNASETAFDQDKVRIGAATDLTEIERAALHNGLTQLNPWRKGPFELFGIHVDAEWRSDWKWRRVEAHISPLKQRRVLDVGCGNGYYAWRMLGAGARLVIGIDPLPLNVIQFHFIRKLYGTSPPVYVLPIGIESLPNDLKAFDTVFSMGVLYHRRSPIDHLIQLRDCLRPGGELILETLIIDGGLGEVLVPEDRYAMMRNVWFLPSCPTLISWMGRCGFKDIRLVDITTTTPEEQRSTQWMPFHSLADHLNPDNPAFTCEGLPAPKRAIIVAQCADR